jgi:HD superfamily phosphohydrolase
VPGASSSPGRERLIRDPIYGYIQVPQLIEPVLGHPFVQRLRRIGQTSLTNLVYPSLTHTRFEHSLGTMHLGRRACLAALRNAAARDPGTLETLVAAITAEGIPVRANSRSEYIADAVGAAGLLHDVGHTPMSHILEDEFHERIDEMVTEDDLPHKWTSLAQVKGPFHEFAGEVLVDQLFEDLVGRFPEPGFPELVKAIYHADPDQWTWSGALHSIVASEVDVDRLDYLMRDGQRAGTEFGAIDYQRLVDSYELIIPVPGEFRVAAGTRARSAVETMLVQRMQSYRWILFHHRVVGGNLALTSARSALRTLQRSQGGVGAIGADGLEGWDLFRPTAVAYNFVAPKPPDLQRALQQATGADLDLSDVTLEAMTQLRRAAQSRIDDVALVHSLEQAQLVCEALVLSEGAAPELVEACSDFLLYCSCVLQRKKNYVSAWKTIEQWSSAAELMWEDESLPKALADMWEELDAKAKTTPGLAAVLAAARSALDERQERHGVVAATNFIVDQLFIHSEYRDQLETMLSTMSMPLNEGRWRVAHAAFRPIRDDTPSVLIRENDGKVTPLTSESPMVEALRQVDAARVRLGVFFFSSRDQGLVGQRDLWSELLIGRVAHVLPQFIKLCWSERLLGLAQPPPA